MTRSRSHGGVQGSESLAMMWLWSSKPQSITSGYTTLGTSGSISLFPVPYFAPHLQHWRLQWSNINSNWTMKNRHQQSREQLHRDLLFYMNKISLRELTRFICPFVPFPDRHFCYCMHTYSIFYARCHMRAKCRALFHSVQILYWESQGFSMDTEQNKCMNSITYGYIKAGHTEISYMDYNAET